MDTIFVTQISNSWASWSGYYTVFFSWSSVHHPQNNQLKKQERKLEHLHVVNKMSVLGDFIVVGRLVHSIAYCFLMLFPISENLFPVMSKGFNSSAATQQGTF